MVKLALGPGQIQFAACDQIKGTRYSQGPSTKKVFVVTQTILALTTSLRSQSSESVMTSWKGQQREKCRKQGRGCWSREM